MSLSAVVSAVGRRLRTPLILPIIAYAVLACVMFSHFLAHPTRGVPGGPDGIIYTWYFEWVEQALIHAHNPFVSGALNAPFGVNAMWNTSMLVVAIACIPLTALFGPFAAVVIVAVVGPVASASTAYYVIRQLSGSTYGGILAGLLFGFGPFFVGQNGHIHLSFAVFVPILLLLGHRLIVTQDRSPIRTGIWLGVALGLSLLATQEVVAFAAVVAVIAVIVLAALYPRQIRPRIGFAAKGLGVAAAVTLVIDAVPLYYQFYGPLALQVSQSPRVQKQDLAGLVRPTALQRFTSAANIAANRHYPANGTENTGYLGWPLVIVCLAILVWLVIRRDRFAAWWFLTAAATVVMSMGTPLLVDGHRIGPGPWHVLGKLPLLKGAIPVRLSLITTLLVGLLLAVALGKLTGRVRIIAMVVAGLALVPLIPAKRYGSAASSSAPRFFTTSAVNVIRPGSNVMILPVQNSPAGQAPTMVWQIRAHLRFNLVGGYDVINLNGGMSYLPRPPYITHLLVATPADGPLNAGKIEDAKQSLQQFDVNYIVIADSQRAADRAVQVAATITGCTPQHIIDVTVCQVPRG